MLEVRVGRGMLPPLPSHFSRSCASRPLIGRSGSTPCRTSICAVSTDACVARVRSCIRFCSTGQYRTACRRVYRSTYEGFVLLGARGGDGCSAELDRWRGGR
eukprot:3639951-Rhodomonas_salina.1